MMNWLGKCLTKIEDMLAIIAGTLIFVSMITIVVEIIRRNMTGRSFVWVQEYNEYLLLYIPFLAGAWLLRNHGHVVINLIDNIISKGSSKILKIIVAILGVLSMAILVYYSSLVTYDMLANSVTSTTVLRTPQFYVYIVIPVGSFLMLLEFIRSLTHSFNESAL
ncbi:TRAP transporter small permease [Evansella clarkii]|uniref:TRAP transporter small permease n=1 Tax=Evansella clarkii TaxID=79879 RepID=UPI000996106A|nr:TRAP transporter small permease [Evansella clarkii]